MTGLEWQSPGQETLRRPIHVDVTPTVSDWSTGFQEDLLPVLARAVRSTLPDSVVSSKRPGVTTWEQLIQQHDITLLDGGYAHALTRYTLQYHDRDESDLTEYEQGYKQEQLLPDLTEIGQGAGPGPYNTSIEDLHDGPFQVIRELVKEPPVITVSFDTDAWSNVEDPRTGQRALEYLEVISTVCDVYIRPKPATQRLLKKHYPDWLETHGLDLSSRDESTPPTGPTTTDETQTRERAHEALDGITDGDGKLRILSVLPPEKDEYRTVKTLKQDTDIALANGSVDAYIDDLEDRGLVRIERDYTGSNRVYLSSIGRTATSKLLTPSHTVRSPHQRGLSGYLTQTLQPSASTVYSAKQSPKGGEGIVPVEGLDRYIASTGDPDWGDRYVQWLGHGDPGADNYVLHKRITAVREGDDISLVDDRLERFEDGRVGYLSAFDDEVLTVVQWGGPLATLGRLVGILLSDLAVNKILTQSRLGREFDELDDSDKAAIEDVLRWGHQVGWLGESETTYHGWRKRFLKLKRLLLEELGELSGTTDRKADREQLFRDLHGLLGSVTQLYYAAGLDVVVNLRVPDFNTLQADDQRYRDFLDFFKYTIPKNTVYDIHSGNRMLLEDRPEKLKRRLSYEIDDTDRSTELTADWIISGPTASDLRSDLEDELNNLQHEVRDAVRDGVEDAAVMEFPIRVANSYANIKRLITALSRKKGKEIAGEFDRSEHHDIEQLTRVFMSALSDSSRPHRANPHDVVVALMAIASSQQPSLDYLTISDIEYGLSQLHPERVFPDIAPSATKLLQTLLRSDGPLGRSELLEEAGVSASSYDRHIDTLRALELVVQEEQDGYPVNSASLVPWWTPLSNKENPAQFENPDLGLVQSTNYQDVGSQIALRLGLLTDNTSLLEAYRSTAHPSRALDEYTDAALAFEQWRGYIWVWFADLESETPPWVQESTTVSGVARVGSLPVDLDASQLELEQLTQASSSIGVVGD